MLRLLPIFLVALSTPALTADLTTASSFSVGFVHPLKGLDHLLAMVAVGVWGAYLGRPLVWQLPIAFPMVMAMGGAMGILGVLLPMVERGVALSVIVLGLALASAYRASIPVAVGIVAFFAVLHGYAHGVELPRAVLPAAYASGFVVATGLLHLSGIAIGLMVKLPKGTMILRAGGAAMALIGIGLFFGFVQP